ncbi:olfactory receptor 10P1-like [Branchiostoma floridae]|uniref:Olfactory receptor 10P1-like n=1 Tax=Branchiostoma floridae TaxID=7739 RepID=A0A9J7HN50_BRAFL|nr:olfactory receptor 10P1-like [Branchiostoma floridae]
MSDSQIFGTENPVARGFQIAYLVTTVALSVVCGLLVIVLVWKKEYLQKPCHYLRCNLAVDDILFTGLCVPNVIHNISHGYNPASFTLCRVEGAFTLGLLLSKTCTYLLMAMDVYFFIIHPLHYNDKVTTPRVAWAIAAARTLTFVVALTSVAVGGSGNTQDVSDVLVCLPGMNSSPKNTVLAILIVVVPIAVFVVLAVGALYYRVLKEAREQQHRDEDRHLQLHETQAFRALAPHFTVVLVFVGTAILSFIFARAAQTEGASIYLSVARRVAMLLNLSLSYITDSVVYSLKKADFRRAMGEVLPFINEQAQPQVPHHTVPKEDNGLPEVDV